MMRRLQVALIAMMIGAFSLWSAAGWSDDAGELRFSGTSDASAAVAVDETHFLVADDENNTLRLYRWDRPGLPVALVPWDAQLDIDPDTDKHPEADIEGAAVLGEHVYCVSSHGRNKNGKWRPNRHRFFAITVTPTPTGIRLEPFGKPIDSLARYLAADCGLDDVVRAEEKKNQRLAPKRDGLNIEGLAAMPDGRSLLIGLRNPLREDRCLLIPFTNPQAVVCEGASPEFGDLIELRLPSGRGGSAGPLAIRSIEYLHHAKSFLVVAGPRDREAEFAVYRWSGSPTDQPERLEADTAAVSRPIDFSPEALIAFPGQQRILVLSDDGSRRVRVGSAAECRQGTFDRGQCEAKRLLDPARKTFRGLWLTGF